MQLCFVSVHGPRETYFVDEPHILNCTVLQKADPSTRVSPDIYSFYYLNNISEADKFKDLIGDS
jgi:hypothetical protein